MEKIIVMKEMKIFKNNVNNEIYIIIIIKSIEFVLFKKLFLIINDDLYYYFNLLYFTP